MVGNITGMFLHTSIAMLGTILALIISILPMAQGETDIHLKFLTNYEENEHEAFWQCRMQVNKVN